MSSKLAKWKDAKMGKRGQDINIPIGASSEIGRGFDKGLSGRRHRERMRVIHYSLRVIYIESSGLPRRIYNASSVNTDANLNSAGQAKRQVTSPGGH